MRRTLWLSTLLTLAVGSACAVAPTAQTGQPAAIGQAMGAGGAIDDSDLAPPRVTGLSARLEQEGTRTEAGLSFPLIAKQPIRALPTSRQFTVKGALHYLDKQGRELPLARVTVSASGRQVLTDAQGRFELPMAGAGELSFALANDHWSLKGKSGTYRWVYPVSGAGTVDLGVLMPEKGSVNGQAAWIHALFVKAENQFVRYGLGLDWWNESIPTTWPGNGNYYSWGSLNLTDADHWDVNGHELGHALSHMAFNMRSGGGQHYIDRCYAEALAWSEGVASFISAVISIDRDDPDAKFEYMVPRRAPIRMEHVPADVCEGPGNEWRAGAALWDLFDTHVDGDDRVAIELPVLWQAWRKGNGASAIGSVTDAYALVAKAVPAQREALRLAMAQNTMPVSLFAAGR